jgi:segregation and condensation protein A
MPETGFTFASQRFEGPLERLLDLIEARKLPISDVSLASVTDAYIAYVQALPAMPLSETSQFILVASTLLLIKSRSLLPIMNVTEDERESVHELERRLKKLRIFREAAKLLKTQWGSSPLLTAQRAPEKPVLFSPAEVSVIKIHAAVHNMLSTIPKEEKRDKVSVAPVLALEDVIVTLRNRLTSAFRTRFSDVVRGARDRHEVIVYFLAMLELVRSGSASVVQDRLFEDIVIEVEQIGTPRFGV